MPEIAKQIGLTRLLLWMHPIQRIFISIILTFIVYLFIRQSHISALLKIMVLWDVFAFSLLFTSWIVFVTRTTEQIREYARNDDGNIVFVFLIIIISAFASM